MNEKDFKNLLDKTESKYLECWKILSSFKKKPDKSIVLFQGILCEALIDLSKAYKKINQLRNDLIERKRSFSKTWFSSRQNTLSERQKKIVEVSGIGKAMGDSFAWFFYHNDRALLDEHSKHQYSKIMPTGLGGLGEMMFVKNIKMFDKYLVIYNGTTTILRIGDISLIDLSKLKVAGIGEIKTSPEGKGKLSIGILMNFTSSSLPIKMPKAKKLKKGSMIDDLPQKSKDRLKRQMVKIGKTLSEESIKKPKQHMNMHINFYYNEFEKLYGKSACYILSYGHFGKGLLCGIYRQRKRSLYSALCSKTNLEFNSKLEGLKPRTEKLLLKGSKFNDLKIGAILYLEDGTPWLMPGAIPLFWWPINIELIKKIIFRQDIIFTVYTPAHFVDALQKEGFEVHKKEGRRLDFLLEKEFGDHKMQFENIWFFIELITQCLIRESEAVKMILYSIDQSKTYGKQQERCRIDFRFSQMLGRLA